MSQGKVRGKARGGMARGGWLSSAAQSPQEAFQKFSLERSVVREGSFVRQDRIDLLLILIKPENIRAYAAMQKFVDKVAALRETHPCGSTTNVLWEQECKAAMNRSKIASWRAISLEFIVTIVLETELDECVVLMESLKFWRQLAQMQVHLNILCFMCYPQMSVSYECPYSFPLRHYLNELTFLRDCSGAYFIRHYICAKVVFEGLPCVELLASMLCCMIKQPKLGSYKGCYILSEA